MMYHGLLAMLSRSLRQDVREMRSHVFRLAFLLFMYLGLLSALLTAGFRGAPGLEFFRSITILNLVFITCAGVGYFATAITEEKEEDVLGLLTMAGLNPLAILLGKSTSRLIQSALLLVLQIPFTLLSITLGGVTFHQVFAAYVALFAYLILIANVALFWSTVCDRSGSAAALTLAGLVIYALIPELAPAFAARCVSWGLSPQSWLGSLLLPTLEAATETGILNRVGAIMATGFSEPIVSRQVLVDSVLGVVSFGLAWAAFRPVMRRAASGAMRAAAWSSGASAAGSVRRFRFVRRGRVWKLPLAWKAFHFAAGGYPYLALKLSGFLVVFAWLVGSSLWLQQFIDWEGTRSAMSVVIVATAIGEASVMASRLFHDEVRMQTFSSLLMLPRSLVYLSYTSALGCLLSLVPTVSCYFLVRPFSLGFFGVLYGVIVFLHLVVLLSLFVRWGALPLAVVLMIPMLTCCPIWQIAMVLPGIASSGFAGEFLAVITLSGVAGAVCLILQMMIGSRLEEIAAQ